MKFLIITIAALMVATAQCRRYYQRTSGGDEYSMRSKTYGKSNSHPKPSYGQNGSDDDDGSNDIMGSKAYGKSTSSYNQPKPSYGQSGDDHNDNMGSKAYGKSTSSYNQPKPSYIRKLFS